MIEKDGIDGGQSGGGPDEDRPVIDTRIKATATAHTRPVSWEDKPDRTGTVRVRASVVVDCTCEKEVTVYSDQPIICQGCGRRWRFR